MDGCSSVFAGLAGLESPAHKEERLLFAWRAWRLGGVLFLSSGVPPSSSENLCHLCNLWIISFRPPSAAFGWASAAAVWPRGLVETGPFSIRIEKTLVFLSKTTVFAAWTLTGTEIVLIGIVRIPTVFASIPIKCDAF